MRKNQQLVIVLPEGSEELPIRIVRGSRSMELRLCLCPPDGEERHINETCPERKYVFIWRRFRAGRVQILFYMIIFAIENCVMNLRKFRLP